VIDLCRFPDCDRERKYRNWCGPHYKQEKSGKPLTPLQNRGGVWALGNLLKWAVSDGECLIWPTTKKYGNVWHGGKCWKAHRLAFYLATGDDPEDGTVHHTCANTRCINPNHLERASRVENTLEMLARTDYEARIKALEARVKELEAERESRAVIM
jgi:hypothetical protein